MAYDLKMNGTAYLLKLAAFVLLLFLWMVYQLRQNPEQFMWNPYDSIYVPKHVSGYVSTFLIGLIFLGVLIGTSFSNMGNKVKRTLYLQLPASTMEKYLQPILVRILLGTGLYFLLYWVVAQLAFLTYEHIPFGYTMTSVNGWVFKPEVFNYSMIFNDEDPLGYIVLFFVALGTYLYASPLFFRNYQLLKSILVFFIGGFLVASLLVILSHLFYPGEVNGFDVEFRGVMVIGKITNVDLFLVPLVYISWLYFLVIGYFRLKESTL